MTSFAYVLYICRVNASTILALNNAKDPRMHDSFDFGMDLLMALVRLFVEMRLCVGITTEIQRKICTFLGETNAPTQSPQQAALLPAQISGKGAKIAKDKLSKVLSQCQACGKAVCQSSVQFSLIYFAQFKKHNNSFTYLVVTPGINC